tara:strand:+ start:235 stop:762 length:528 start_codon:yes stop_codon:yes gene_type:complete
MGYYGSLILRVFLALILRVEWIYFIVSPLTLLLSYSFVSLFGYDVVINFSSSRMVVEDRILNFVEACSAGVAYYLLALLILLTKGIKWGLRLKMFLIGSLMIFFVNLVRVLILIIVLVEYGVYYFEAIHLFFWDVVASVLVVGIWVFLTEKYKIKEVPILSDLRELWKRSYFGKG